MSTVNLETTERVFPNPLGGAVCQTRMRHEASESMYQGQNVRLVFDRYERIFKEGLFEAPITGVVMDRSVRLSIGLHGPNPQTGFWFKFHDFGIKNPWITMLCLYPEMLQRYDNNAASAVRRGDLEDLKGLARFLR